jgi:hypothetical protein
MDITSRLLLWIPWSKIAIKHEAAAVSAAHNVAQLILRGEYTGEAMNDELEASLVVITASANALEAIYGGLAYAAADAVPPDTTRPDWRKILLALDAAFDLSPAAEARWQPGVSGHFSAVRNAVVHHKETNRGLRRQAAGVLTSPEMSDWDARRATASVDLLLEVIEVCGTASVRDVRFEQSRDELAVNAGTLKLLRSREVPQDPRSVPRLGTSRRPT